MFVINKKSCLHILDKYSAMKQDFIANAFHAFKYTKYAMIEEFRMVMKELKKIEMNELEASKIFNRMMAEIYVNQ